MPSNRVFAGAPVSIDEHQRLHAAAERLGVSFADVVRTLLVSALEDFESGDLTFEVSDANG